MTSKESDQLSSFNNAMNPMSFQKSSARQRADTEWSQGQLSSSQFSSPPPPPDSLDPINASRANFLSEKKARPPSLPPEGKGRGFVRDVSLSSGLPILFGGHGSQRSVDGRYGMSFIAACPDGEHFVVVDDTKRMHVVTVHGECLVSYDVYAAPTSVVFQEEIADGRFYRLFLSCWAEVGEDAPALVLAYDLDKDRIRDPPTLRFKLDGHTKVVRDVKVERNGEFVVSCGDDGFVIFWIR